MLFRSVYPIRIDTARSKFEISGRPSNPEESMKDDENGFKRALRERLDKWRDLKNDPELQKREDVEA